MKQLFLPVASLLLATLLMISCEKEVKPSYQQEGDASANGHLKQTKTFSSEVAQEWMDLQLQILRLPQGPNPFGLNGNRWFAYFGIALYESVVPGMPAYQTLSGQLNNMPGMPETVPGKAYHWPASANAALAFLTRSWYGNHSAVSTENKDAIDALENELRSRYQQEVDAATFERSENFGKEVAQRILAWSATDGPTTVPCYPGPANDYNWTPTDLLTYAPGTNAAASNWGCNRLFVPGSTNGAASPLPPAYSTEVSSEYYQMVKEVYDLSKMLTEPQKAAAFYFRDNPGFQGGTHYQYIFSQIMRDENLQLDFFAVAQAKVAIAMAESQIFAWQLKYSSLVDRPTRYIKTIIGDADWKPLLGMPNHPDFPSGHSQTGGAFAGIMTTLFGENYPVTLRTYDNLGMDPRPYSSFDEMVDDIGKSRVYAGIHYTYSCVEGKNQGVKLAGNILNIVKFKKG